MSLGDNRKAAILAKEAAGLNDELETIRGTP